MSSQSAQSVSVYRPRHPRLVIAGWNFIHAMILSVPILLLPVPAVPATIVILSALAFSVYRSVTMFLQVDLHGVVTRNVWRTVRIPWDDITAIEARRVFLDSSVDLRLYFVRRSGKPVAAAVTQYPGRDGQALIDMLRHTPKGKPIPMPFKPPDRPRWYKKGSDSWKVTEPEHKRVTES